MLREYRPFETFVHLAHVDALLPKSNQDYHPFVSNGIDATTSLPFGSAVVAIPADAEAVRGGSGSGRAGSAPKVIHTRTHSLPLLYKLDLSRSCQSIP